MKKPTTTTPPPKPKATAKGRPISEDDDFGEATFARALKTVKDTLAQVTPEGAKPAPKSKKR